MNFNLYSALTAELDRMEENGMNALKALDKYKGEFKDEEYLKGTWEGELEAVKIIRKIMELYKK